MANRDEPPDPREVLVAAEAAHLAARRSGPVPDAGRRPGPDAAAGRRATQDRDRRGRTGPVGTPGPGRLRLRLPGWLPHPPAGRLPGAGRRAPLPLAAAVAAGWAATVSFAPVLVLAAILQAAEAGLAVGGPARLAGTGWLLAHGVPVQTPEGPVGLAPLLLTGLAAWRVARAGVHATRAIGARRSRSAGRAGQVAVAVAIGYGLIGMLVAGLAGEPGWGPSVPRAGWTLAGFGLLAAGYGALQATGVLAVWLRRLPVWLHDAVRVGLVAACGVLAAGAALAGIALATGGGAAAGILAAYRTNVAGQAGLTLLCLVYAPNLAGWATAYLLGPGFAVGTGTVVRSSEVTLGWLPPLPVFAGLPDAALPTLGAVLLVMPVGAGAVGGWLLARWTPGWRPALLGAVVSGVAAAGLLGLTGVVSSGSVGGGQLAAIGPEPALVAGSAALTVTAGALLGVTASLATARRRPG